MKKKKKMSFDEWLASPEGRKAYQLMVKAGKADAEKIRKMRRISYRNWTRPTGPIVK